MNDNNNSNRNNSKNNNNNNNNSCSHLFLNILDLKSEHNGPAQPQDKTRVPINNILCSDVLQ